MHYRDRTLSPEAIWWRQAISLSAIGEQEVARVRGNRDVRGVTSGQRGAQVRLSAGLQQTNVSGNRDPDTFEFILLLLFYFISLRVVKSDWK